MKRLWEWFSRIPDRREVYVLFLASMVTTGLVCVATFRHIDLEVERQMGQEFGRLVDRFEQAVERIEKVEVSQDNNQQVIVPDREAELRDLRIRERWQHKIGAIE